MNFQEPESEAGRGDQVWTPLSPSHWPHRPSRNNRQLRTACDLKGKGLCQEKGEGHTPGVTKILSTKNAVNSSGGGELDGGFPRVPVAQLHAPSARVT